MPKTGKEHMSKEMREVIETGINQGDSARTIARRIGVSASTVTREVKKNRTIKEKRVAPNAKLSTRCVHYRDCQASGSACEKCSTRLTTCKHCKTRDCTKTCATFKRAMCPTTEKWPYVCPLVCTKRSYCSFPKCSYRAHEADSAYKDRLSASRVGIDLTDEELAAMRELVVPLVKQGQSFEAIWATHKDELPVCVRTAYSYQDAGLFGIEHLHLPRKVRVRKRKQDDKPTRERIDRTGRTFDDFKALPLEEQARVVQGDSVVGLEGNAQDILSLHLVAYGFQIYVLKRHAEAKDVVAWLDVMERACGTRQDFKAAFGILLVDRGVEFDDWEGMERSCLEEGKQRCRVFYCDAMKSNQKSQAERNHEQLRRILPKKRSNFDALNVWDVALCSSHVNSYPSAMRANRCPFELIGGILPQALLDELGLSRVAPDDVVLKPSLMKHATTQ